MKKDKIRLILIATGTILLLTTAILYSLMIAQKEKINLGNLIPLIIPLLIIIFMAFFIIRRYKGIKSGMPLEDEYSKKVMLKASSVSYYLTLYWLLFIGWFEEPIANLFGLQHLDAGQTTGAGIVGMAIFLFALWFYYSKKPNLA
ncbi:MAG: hypothetical protein WC675_05215 [Patescibacteria group bacterium]|jgi:hypothetical protein